MTNVLHGGRRSPSGPVIVGQLGIARPPLMIPKGLRDAHCDAVLSVLFYVVESTRTRGLLRDRQAL